jgi:hypothetical protein
MKTFVILAVFCTLFQQSSFAGAPRPPQPISDDSVNLANEILAHSDEVKQKLAEAGLAGAFINGGTFFIVGPTNPWNEYQLTLQTCPLSSAYGTCDPKVATLSIFNAWKNNSWVSTITVQKTTK